MNTRKLREWSTYRAAMTGLADGTVDLVNRINSQGLIFAVLMLFFFRIRLNSDEAYYLTSARQLFEGKEMNGLVPVYQYFMGFLLHYLPVEYVAGTGKILLGVLLTWSLGRLYQLFSFSNIDTLLHLSMFYLFDKLYLGGYGQFLSLEPKAFAYPFIFFSIVAALKTRYRIAAGFSTVASCLNLPVGGWFFLCFGCYYVAVTRRRSVSAGVGLIIAAILISLIFLLITGLLWPAVLLPLPWPILKYTDAAFVLAALFFIVVFLFSRSDAGLNRSIHPFNVALLSGSLSGLAAAFLGVNGPYFEKTLLQIAGLACFLVLLQAVFLFRRRYIDEHFAKHVQFGILTWSVLAIGFEAAIDLVLNF